MSFSIENSGREFDKLDLSLVKKPSRYIGGEVGSVVKQSPRVRFAFGFPDVYEVGMSYMGLHLLYQMLNEIDDVAVERVFMPWVDLIEQMQQRGVRLFTYETKTPADEVDIFGFTLQYELSFSNILKMLELAGIPRFTAERLHSDSGDYPLIVAGGPCAVNPEPLAEIVDLFMVGEGEDVLPELLELSRGYDLRSPAGKARFLKRAALVSGVYVPSLYVPVYDGERLTGYEMSDGSEFRKVRRRTAKAYRYTKQVVPFTEIVHDRISMEIFRGCTRGCRFCQAGMIYRPVRENKADAIVRQAEKLVRSTGYDELSIASLSTLDYSEIEPLVAKLLNRFESEGVAISLPSLRMDATSVNVLRNIQKVKKTGLTFAPEAGTQRLRDVINKGVTDEDIKNTFEDIFSLGWFRVKLYFMIGLPTEEDEDIEGIIRVAKRACWIFKQVRPEDMKKQVEVTASASCFVPKPFTPFQWHPQCSIAEFERKIGVLKNANTGRKVTLNYHAPLESWLEGVFARGDRRLSKVLVRAVELGCVFDGWSEHFKFDLWMQAFADCGISPEYYNERSIGRDEFLPWDIIDAGVSKEFLWREYERSLRAEVTGDCRFGCSACGIGCLSPDGFSTFDFSDDAGFVLKNRNTLSESFEIAAGADELIEKSVGTPHDKSGDTEDAARCTVRFLYKKYGNAVYISHLEMTKLFERAFKRAGVESCYTEGFNPTVRLNFALPISVGLESVYEVAEIELKERSLPAFAALPDELPSGVELVEYKVVVRGAPLMSRLACAEFEIVPVGLTAAAAKAAVRNFSAAENIPYEKRTKKGVKTVNMKDFVVSAECSAGSVRLRLAAGNAGSISPEAAAEHIFGEGAEYKVVRTRLLDEFGEGLY